MAIGAAILTTFLVALGPAQVDGDPPRFVVVRIIDYDRSELDLVMSTADLQALKAELQVEARLFEQGLLAAFRRWNEDEVLRRYKFPSTALEAREVTVIGPLYDTQQKACAALNAMLADKARTGPNRQPSKAEREGYSIVAQAMDLLVEQLDDMKIGSQSRENLKASTNKIVLAPGQVVSRTTAGTTRTAYHIAVPNSFNAESPPPLLVVFSPAGDGYSMMNQVRASANKVGWMVIGCDKLRNGMTIADGLPIERDLIRDLHTLIPYDKTRLYYGGFSGGACRAYRLTWRFKDRCAGILAFGGWLGGREAQRKPFQQNMAIAMVNGDADKGVREWEESDKNVLKQRGCEVRVFHFPGGHVVAPGEVIDEAIAWLDEQAVNCDSRGVHDVNEEQ